MKVRTADRRRRDPHDGVRRFLDGRIRDRVDSYVALAVPGECSHGVTSFLERGDGRSWALFVSSPDPDMRDDAPNPPSESSWRECPRLRMGCTRQSPRGK